MTHLQSFSPVKFKTLLACCWAVLAAAPITASAEAGSSVQRIAGVSASLQKYNQTHMRIKDQLTEVGRLIEALQADARQSGVAARQMDEISDQQTRVVSMLTDLDGIASGIPKNMIISSDHLGHAYSLLNQWVRKQVVGELIQLSPQGEEVLQALSQQLNGTHKDVEFLLEHIPDALEQRLG